MSPFVHLWVNAAKFFGGFGVMFVLQSPRSKYLGMAQVHGN